VAQYKGIVFFSGGFGGWSERYFLLSSTPAGALTNLAAVYNARKAILHEDCGIGPAYISDVAIRGDSMPYLVAPSAGTFADALGFLDLDVCFIIKWQVGVFTRNKTFVRGVPLSMTLNGETNFTVPYAALVNDWTNAVEANCVMPITMRNPTPPPNYIPTSYAPILAGNLVTTLARRKTGRPFGLPRGRRVAP
jgi:hypothetical protein